MPLRPVPAGQFLRRVPHFRAARRGDDAAAGLRRGLRAAALSPAARAADGGAARRRCWRRCCRPARQPARLAVLVGGEVAIGLFIGTDRAHPGRRARDRRHGGVAAIGPVRRRHVQSAGHDQQEPAARRLLRHAGRGADLPHRPASPECCAAAVDSYAVFTPGALPPIGDFSNAVARVAAGLVPPRHRDGGAVHRARSRVLRGARASSPAWCRSFRFCSSRSRCRSWAGSLVFGFVLATGMRWFLGGFMRQFAHPRRRAERWPTIATTGKKPKTHRNASCSARAQRGPGRAVARDHHLVHAGDERGSSLLFLAPAIARNARRRAHRLRRPERFLAPAGHHLGRRFGRSARRPGDDGAGRCRSLLMVAAHRRHPGADRAGLRHRQARLRHLAAVAGRGVEAAVRAARRCRDPEEHREDGARGGVAMTMLARRDQTACRSCHPVAQDMPGEIARLVLRLLLGVLMVLTVLAGADYGYQRCSTCARCACRKREVKEEHEAVRRRSADQGAAAADPHGARAPAHDGGGAGRLGGDHQPDPFRRGAANTRWARRGAPRVVAKGADLIAQRIREIAEENDVPMVENPPLARALYAGGRDRPRDSARALQGGGRNHRLRVPLEGQNTAVASGAAVLD